MPLTQDTFFWIMGLFFALLVAMFLEIVRLDRKLSPISDLARHIQRFSTEQGIQSVLAPKGGERGERRERKTTNNPLTLEKVRRRDELLQKGKDFRLAEAEAWELGAILEEAARDELDKGVISPLAFLAIMAINEAFIRFLIKKDKQEPAIQ